MKRKLFHLRAHNLLGTLLPQGGMTLALQYDEEHKRLYYGVSIAVPLDMFNLRRGRQIANGRLDVQMKKGPGFCRGYLDDVTYDGMKNAMIEIVKNCITHLALKLRDTRKNHLKLGFLRDFVLYYHRSEGVMSVKKEEVKEE